MKEHPQGMPLHKKRIDISAKRQSENAVLILYP